MSRTDVDHVLDFMCRVGEPCAVHFRWRPYLRDRKDDTVLELAVVGKCSRIVTYNNRHFRELHHFAIDVVTPVEFLREIGELPRVRQA